MSGTHGAADGRDGIDFRVEGAVAVIGLNAPPMNGLSRPMVARLGGLLAQCGADAQVRALLLHGVGGKAFSAGSDLAELRRLLAAPGALAAKFEQDEEVFGALAAFPKPTVAAIEGLAMGGGLELAVCCDLLVAGQGARLGLPEIKLGVFPGSGGTVRVTRRIGPGRARQMMLLGEPIDAATALQWALVDQLADDGAVLADALKLAQKLARGPALAQRLLKESLDAAQTLPEREALSLARRHGVALGDSADLAEGLRAFDEKRRPQFK